MPRPSIKSYNKPFSGGKSRSRGRGWFERKIYVSSIGRKVAPKHRKVAINYYKSKGHYTPVSAGQVRSKMASRSKRSQLMDRGKQSRRVGSIGNPVDRSQWAKDPGRMDLRGVDTKVKPKYRVPVKKPTVKPKPKEPVKKVVKPMVKPKVKPKYGWSAKGHTWLYGDKKRGYSMEHLDNGKDKWETHKWQDGEIVRSNTFHTETEARGYIQDKEAYYNGLKKSQSQRKFEMESDKIVEKKRIKPKKEVKKEPVKPKEEPVEPLVKTKLVIEPETELSALKKQEMKYYREEVGAKSDEAKMQAYEKRLAISKKIKRLTTPPRPKKPELEPWQKQLNHESKQISRIQKLDDRIYKQTSMDAELQVVKKEYDPKGDGGKDPVLFERQVERHRTKLKDDISSLKQDKKVSIADNKIKYAGDYMTYSHGLTEEEFKAIR